jgi:hypothetical protein
MNAPAAFFTGVAVGAFLWAIGAYFLEWLNSEDTL